MRLVQLAANLVTERGADPQGTAAQQQMGSQIGGVGSRIKRIQALETAFGAPRVQIKFRPRLGELKRYLRAKNEGNRAIRKLLGSD